MFLSLPTRIIDKTGLKTLSFSFERSGDRVPIMSVDRHPDQSHVLITGSADGVIGIWDIRQEKSPVTLIDAHKSEGQWITLFILLISKAILLFIWEKLFQLIICSY